MGVAVMCVLFLYVLARGPRNPAPADTPEPEPATEVLLHGLTAKGPPHLRAGEFSRGVCTAMPSSES